VAAAVAEQPASGSGPVRVEARRRSPEASSQMVARRPCSDLPDLRVPLWRPPSMVVARQSPFEPEAVRVAARRRSPAVSSPAEARTPCWDSQDVPVPLW
jgi:hypothetical protein